MKIKMICLIVLLSLAILLINISCKDSGTDENKGWELIWSDEFNDVTIDMNKWVFETGYGGNGWGNDEWQYYTSDNVSIEEGKLVITATCDGSPSKRDESIKSARMKTQDKYSLKYGKIEARIKLPMGQGIWPAFWMLGLNIVNVGWPKCGEIDIMEHINIENKIYGTIHWDSNGHKFYGDNTDCNPSDWNTYTIEWDNQEIRWYLNGSQYFNADITKDDTEEFHEPFFILLNLAVGGNWPGSPDSSTSFPARVYVDWVRVYK
jgi:beta-glucanase (GH16 family)